LDLGSSFATMTAQQSSGERVMAWIAVVKCVAGVYGRGGGAAEDRSSGELCS